MSRLQQPTGLPLIGLRRIGPRRPMLQWICVVLLGLSALAGASPGTQPDASDAEPASYSDAELLLRLRQAFADDAQRANVLQARQRELDRQFELQTAEFNRLDALQPAPDAAAEPAADSAPDPASSAASRADATGLQHARELLDLLLQRRQLLTQQLELLERKRSEQQAAAKLVSTGPPSGASVSPAVEPAASAAPADPAASPSGAAGAATADPATTPGAPGAATAPAAPSAAIAALSNAPSLPAAAGATPADAAAAIPPAPPLFDSRVARAERHLQHRQALLVSTEQTMRLIESLRALNVDERHLVRDSLTLAERHVNVLRQRLALLATRPEPGAAPDPSSAPPVEQRGPLPEIHTPAPSASLRERLQQDSVAAQHAARVDEERLVALQERIDALGASIGHLESALDDAGRDADLARRKLEFFRSPLAPHRIADWLVSGLPRIAIGLSILALVWLVGRWIARRVVGSVLNRIRTRPSPDEQRMQRVETLRRALRSALTVAIVILAALIVLPEFGIDAKVLMGGAAVLSLALAFGAQSLVKDYFSGFMILSENQYRIGNVVRINELAGVVEDITLRMTMLRDAEGVAHFIPHGQITTVSNLTHGWSQVVVDVRVGLDADVDRVMDELLQVARSLKQDERYGPLIVAEPELWGVDAITDAGIVIKLALRTRPLKQWDVKRQLLRRIKLRFDELGIALPTRLLTVTMHDAQRSGQAARSNTLHE